MGKKPKNISVKVERTNQKDTRAYIRLLEENSKKAYGPDSKLPDVSRVFEFMRFEILNFDRGNRICGNAEIGKATGIQPKYVSRLIKQLEDWKQLKITRRKENNVWLPHEVTLHPETYGQHFMQYKDGLPVDFPDLKIEGGGIPRLEDTPPPQSEGRVSQDPRVGYPTIVGEVPHLEPPLERHSGRLNNCIKERSERTQQQRGDVVDHKGQDWERVRADLLMQFPKEPKRIDYVYREILRTGKVIGFKDDIAHPVAYLKQCYKTIRKRYAHIQEIQKTKMKELPPPESNEDGKTGSGRDEYRKIMDNLGLGICVRDLKEGKA